MLSRRVAKKARRKIPSHSRGLDPGDSGLISLTLPSLAVSRTSGAGSDSPARIRRVARDNLSASEARRIALAAQGLGRPRPAGRVDLRHLRRAIGRLGLLQLDFVNVVVPAHYQVLFSRLGPYDRSLLERLAYRRRELTEQWAHEASLVPVELWPHLAHRREDHPPRPWRLDGFLDQHPGYVDSVLAEIDRRGPLAAEDLTVPDGVSRRLDGSWYGTVPRALLENLFGRGLLAVAERRANMARVFDRSERLFDFDYRFEIFIPREQRRWGCYVLPFLQGERLVARVDLKADRPNGRLLV